jgi:hypothetical protein
MMNDIPIKVTKFNHTPFYYTCNYNTFCLNCLTQFMCLIISCWFKSPHFETLASCWTIFKHAPCFHILHTCQPSWSHKVRYKSHPLSNVLLINIHLFTSSTMKSSTNTFKNPTKVKDLVAHLLLHNTSNLTTTIQC